MIDTDKYEGHSPAPWYYRLETEDKIWDEHGSVLDKNMNCLALVDDGSEQFPDADLKLIADAPLILEAYKRLREENDNRWVVIGKLRRQIKELQDDLEDWMAGEYHAGSD
tara:strand:+ start:1805 stop:2134 length:330 start_codon:yes stop_codon:yes gene_type:complete